MPLFTEKSNPGLDALYRIAHEDYEPYLDRLRSTNDKQFVRDTTLDKKPKKKVVVEVGLEPTINTV